MAEPLDDIDREFRKIRRSMNAYLARAAREGRLAEVLLKMEREAMADWKGRVTPLKALPQRRRPKKKA